MNQILVIKNFQIDIVEKLHLVKKSDCTAAKPTSSHPTSKNTRNLGNTRNWFCHNLLVDMLGRLSCDDNHNGEDGDERDGYDDLDVNDDEEDEDVDVVTIMVVMLIFKS